MTEDTLTRFIDRINLDEQFRERARRNPVEALAELDPLMAERLGAAPDEDWLRRLSAGVEQDARFWTWVKKGLSKLFCGPGGTRSWECPKAP